MEGVGHRHLWQMELGQGGVLRNWTVNLHDRYVEQCERSEANARRRVSGSAVMSRGRAFSPELNDDMSLLFLMYR